MVTAGWRSTNRNRCSAGLPATGRTHRPACVVANREKILSVEVRRVSRVSSWSDRMGDGSTATPIYPYVADACAAALRRCRSNRVA